MRAIALSVHELFKKNFNVVKKDLENYRPSVNKCRTCEYSLFCEFRKKLFPDLTTFTEYSTQTT